MEKVIGTIITCLVSAGMGYVLNGLKTYKHHAKKLLEEFAQLKQGGDSYIHDLYERYKKWKIKKTGVRI